MIGYSNAIQEYVRIQSSGNVTLPVNGSWIQAYCEYLGVTEASNESWLQALCEHFGITEPLYGAWVIALANYYGITTPYPYGSWWGALAHSPEPLPTFVWNENTINWESESRTWSLT